jgi:hypothetical protein
MRSHQSDNMAQHTSLFGGCARHFFGTTLPNCITLCETKPSRVLQYLTLLHFTRCDTFRSTAVFRAVVDLRPPAKPLAGLEEE